MLRSHPRPVALLLNATLADGALVDVRIEGGTVVDVRPASRAAAELADDVLDLAGMLLLPAAADAHAHLDKALTWDAIRPPAGDLGQAIRSYDAYAARLTEQDVLDRARRAALALLANGTTAVRSHVNLLEGDDPLLAVRALVRLREELAGLMTMQLVALGSERIADATLEAAVLAGVDLVGGAPHLAADPLAELERLVAVAERLGVGADLHTDEGLHGEPTLGVYADRVADWPADRVRSAGHCVRLGTLPEAQRDDIVARVVRAGVGVIALPITNLYLQGWEQPVATPRGLTALDALLGAGAIVGAGGDNVRDPFNPIGRSDPAETAMLLVAAGHLGLEQAWSLVGDGSRRVMGLPEAGPVAGLRADLLAIRAGSLGEAIAEGSAERTVIHAGRIVAQSTVSRRIATTAQFAHQGE